MNDLILHTVDNEPRVLDIELAEYFAYERPRAIRDLIKRHEETLVAMGPLHREAVQHATGPATIAFHLNKPQAIFITTQSGTDTAVKMTAQVVMKFDAYERGLVRQQLPDFRSPAEAARAWAEQYEERQVAEQKLIEAQPKLRAWQDLCDATGTISSDVIAKSVGYRGARHLHQRLHQAGLIYPVRNKKRAIVDWRPYAEHAPKGYMRAIAHSINGRVITKTQWTPEGAAFIRANFAA